MPTVAEIQAGVALVAELAVDELLGDRRARMYVRPRHLAMHLAVALTRLPVAEIGRRFGDRDHTTVLHAKRRIDALLADDADLAVIHRRALQAIARATEARDWAETVR